MVVIDLVRRVARENDAAVIVVTHDEKIVDRLDNIIVLRDGRMAQPETTGRRASVAGAALAGGV